MKNFFANQHWAWLIKGVIISVVLSIVAVAYFSSPLNPLAKSQVAVEQRSNPLISQSANRELAVVETRVLATDLEVPWGLAFLPDGSALISERESGRLLQLDESGKVKEVQRIKINNKAGEGGLLGIAISPKFASDGLVYAYYSAANDNRVVRFKLGQNPQPILTGIRLGRGRHNGGRIAFGPDGLLYVGTADAGDGGKTSQNRNSLNGKILRLTPNGKPAPGNPFGTEVYSYGHRNVQGLAWDAKGDLYASELGEGSDDEINKIEPGKNYGWPKAIGENGCKRSGMRNCVDPIVSFSPSEASPSGATFLKNGSILQWEGSFFMAGLRGECVWRVTIDPDGKVVNQQRLFKGKFGRIRLVVQAPDGSLWLLTSNNDGRSDATDDDDRIIRIGPKDV